MTACQQIQNISKEKFLNKKTQMKILELKIISERKQGIEGRLSNR